MAPLSTSKLPPAMAPPPPPPHLPNPNPNPHPNPHPNNLFSIHANSAAFPPSYWNSDHHQQQPPHFSASSSSSSSSSNASRNPEQEEHITGLDHGRGHVSAAAAAPLDQRHHHHHHHPHHHLLLHEDARAFMTDQNSGSYVMPKLESAAAEAHASAIKAERPASGEEGLMSHGGAAAGKRSGPERNVAMERPAEGGMTMAIASLEDGSIGLKLGKRTYYEDSAGGGGGGGAADPAALEAAPMENSTNRSNSTAMAMVAVAVKAANPNGKKQKPSSSSSSSSSSLHPPAAAAASSSSSLYAGVVPKCQAEGCTADLSGSKEYHRRHKVCEWHSKASKARVANIEQRFCQQCSRFHVLSEFDEGKRSCRRRLAGHNERRRKPPQEPMSLLSPSFAFFPDGLRMNALLDHPSCFSLQRRSPSPSPSPLLYSSSSSSSNSNSSCTPYLACQLGLGGAGPSSPFAQSLSFSNSAIASGGPTSYGGAPSAPQLTLNPNSDATQKPSSETSISGRALSLLSSINSMAPHMDLLPLPLSLPPSASASASSSALQISDDHALHRHSHRHGHHHHHVAVAVAQASSSSCHGNNPASSASYDSSCLMQPAFHSLLLGSNAQKSMMNMNHAFDSSSSSSSLMNAASSNTINDCSLAMDHEGKSMFSMMSSNNHNHIPLNDPSTGFQNLQSSNQNPNMSSNPNPNMSSNQNPNMSSNQSHHNRSSGSSRPVLDLMQANSRPQIQTQQLMVQDAVPYTTDLQGLSIFGRQSII